MGNILAFDCFILRKNLEKYLDYDVMTNIST